MALKFCINYESVVSFPEIYSDELIMTIYKDLSLRYFKLKLLVKTNKSLISDVIAYINYTGL